MAKGNRDGHLLLLAGSGEARVLAGEISAAGTPGITASLLFPPRAGGGLGIPTRVGPFGGEDGFRAFLDEAKITAVLDAVHPFASRMSDRSARVCRELGLPYARVLRPPWRAEPADKWTEVSGAAEAGTLLRQGQRVFTTIGRADLPELARSAQATIWARYLRAHPPPELPGVTHVRGQGPFLVEEEMATFAELGIDVLVVKNSGGDAGRPKLDAARRIGMPVILIARPAPPDAPCLDSVEAAMRWVREL